MTRQWIDFKRLKQRLDFAKVLEHYGVEYKAKGEQATGRCPLPTHEEGGKSPSFSAHLKKGIWQCFGCKAKGNVLDFAVLMEGLDLENRQNVRQVAMKLGKRFGTEAPSSTTKPEESRSAATTDKGERRAIENSEAKESGATVVNQPLDFKLKGLDAEHPYLRERGFSPQTIQRFGLGYCSRGLLKGRVAIPIHDTEDGLVGYAGRLVDEGQVSKANPKYKFPPARERNGVVHEFHKSRLLYNANRILTPVMNLIVVEGFASVWWLYQWGFADAVALMGSSCSSKQAEIIVSKVAPDGQVLAMPDGNEAGRRCAFSVFEAVGTKLAIRWVKLSDEGQPTDCSPEELSAMLSCV